MNRNAIIAAVVIALAVVGGIYAYQNFGSSPSVTEDSACSSDGCDWTGGTTLRVGGGGYPAKCPKCGNSTVLRGTKCRGCGTIQIHNILLKAQYEDKKDLPDRMNCKNCKAPLPWGS